MLDICGGYVSNCLIWFSSLTIWEKVFLIVAFFILLFIFLRIVYWFIVEFFE